jgi:hypothetical protein
VNTPDNKPDPWTGRAITVVYRIKDGAEWGKTNPLHYAHNSIEAYCALVGDVLKRHDRLIEALEQIETAFPTWAGGQIAKAALEADAKDR